MSSVVTAADGASGEEESPKVPSTLTDICRQEDLVGDSTLSISKDNALDQPFCQLSVVSLMSISHGFGHGKDEKVLATRSDHCSQKSASYEDAWLRENDQTHRPSWNSTYFFTVRIDLCRPKRKSHWRAEKETTTHHREFWREPGTSWKLSETFWKLSETFWKLSALFK